jgi:hypothetical protein
MVKDDHELVIFFYFQVSMQELQAVALALL